MKETTIAWAAGLFDGEGTIIFGKRNKVFVAISMTDLDILERMQSGFGGVIYPLKKRKAHWKDAWMWKINGTKKSLEFLEMIYPYLGVRRQAKVEEARTFLPDLKSERNTRIRQEILNLRDSGLTQGTIAARVGCSREHVNRVLRMVTVV